MSGKAWPLQSSGLPAYQSRQMEGPHRVDNLYTKVRLKSPSQSPKLMRDKKWCFGGFV
jgi:hypothetical protein